jgi:uncharacterized protein (TIGR00251 family)
VIRESPGGVTIDIRVIPRARRTAVAGTREDALLVRVAAPPVKGAANEVVLRYFAAALQVPIRSVTIVSGEHSRRKRLAIAGVGADAVRARLGV